MLTIINIILLIIILALSIFIHRKVKEKNKAEMEAFLAEEKWQNHIGNNTVLYEDQRDKCNNAHEMRLALLDYNAIWWLFFGIFCIVNFVAVGLTLEVRRNEKLCQCSIDQGFVIQSLRSSHNGN